MLKPDSFRDSMQHIITGGAGFIGSHLTDYLTGTGKETVIIDNLSTGRHLNRKAKFFKRDLRLGTDIRIGSNSIIYHLAANPDVKSSAVDTVEHFRSDVLTTINLMELARKHDASKVIFSSSSVVYGESPTVPTPETAPLKPISNYGIFKLFCEMIIEHYSELYDIDYAILRFANVTGGRSTHGIVHDFAMKLRKDKKRLEILGDGRQAKSYIYYDDAVSALVHASKLKSNECFNVGSNDTISVNEIADIVSESMGVSPKYIYINRLKGRGWAGDVRKMRLSIRRAAKLGWKPSRGSKEAIRLSAADAIRNASG